MFRTRNPNVTGAIGKPIKPLKGIRRSRAVDADIEPSAVEFALTKNSVVTNDEDGPAWHHQVNP